MLELPSEPEWDDAIPRMIAIPGEMGIQGMTVGVRVPGGEVVAAFKSEPLAREFVAILGSHYTARAEALFRGKDLERMDPNELRFRGISLREA